MQYFICLPGQYLFKILSIKKTPSQFIIIKTNPEFVLLFSKCLNLFYCDLYTNIFSHNWWLYFPELGFPKRQVIFQSAIYFMNRTFIKFMLIILSYFDFLLKNEPEILILSSLKKSIFKGSDVFFLLICFSNFK